MIFSQIFEMVNVGIVILDKDLNVIKWNRWMESHSKIPADKIVDSPIFEHFPKLNTSKFKRNFKAVFAFGNFSFFSQKLHGYMFPFKATNTLGSNFEHMQQTCTMGPIRDENKQVKYAYIMVQDVTEVAAYEQKLLEMNIKDGLTEIFNRRYLETRLKEEFERHKRYGNTLSVGMLDIDHFKKVNDTYGHQCGDFILKSFASIVSDAIRDVDILARYGGEEFCCLYPETNLKSTLIVAERIRKKIEKKTFEFEGTQVKITISQGIAELNDSIETGEALLNLADKALYEAKETGRNKVVST